MLTVGIHGALSPWTPEVTYTLRTLLRVAGFGADIRFIYPGSEAAVDLYYGPAEDRIRATVQVPWSGRAFAAAGAVEPVALDRSGPVPQLDFGDAPGAVAPGPFTHDIVFAAFWLLTGAREPSYPRSRFDDLDLEGSAFRRLGLLSLPLVSMHGAQLRRLFAEAGKAPLAVPWLSGRPGPAFAFTHDVDYPQMIRPIEALRLLRDRGLRGLSSIPGVLKGTNHFWTFREWVDFEREVGTQPTFYFMARQGSLLQYAMGTPDDFYDVRTPAFTRLFAELRDAGCEIGLHASYHAHRGADQIRKEREDLALASGAAIDGNRHHYWHLDPGAPHETLRRHEEAGLKYDSSLGLEYYPGFRRGICHPFRPFHTGLRRELEVVQLPPAWMDDHFDRRRAKNGIEDPDGAARALVDVARDCGGLVVVDYHSRGMNADFYPRYGPWLMRFVREQLGADVAFTQAGAVLRSYLEYEGRLGRGS